MFFSVNITTTVEMHRDIEYLLFHLSVALFSWSPLEKDLRKFRRDPGSFSQSWSIRDKARIVRVGRLQALDGHPYWQRREGFIWWSHCAKPFAPIVNVLLLHWWVCQFPSDLISQLWSLLSTIRQAQKEAFSCSSVLEIFLQPEKGSRE